MDQLAVIVEWHPNKPDTWKKGEPEIETLLRAHAGPGEHKGKPLKVRIEQKADGWFCTNVWSNNLSCPPSFAKTVDLALRKHRLQP